MDCIDRIDGWRSSISGRFGFVLFLLLVVGHVEVAEFAQALPIVVDFVFLSEWRTENE